MRKFLLIIFVSILILGVSCEKKPEVIVDEFAVKFAEFVNDNEKDSILKYYPDFLLSDSLVEVDTDDIRIKKESETSYIIEYSSDIVLETEINKSGKITIENSYGLISFPEDKIDLAKKTGMWDSEISDTDLSRRMNDNEFFEYLNNNAKEKTKNILKIGAKHYPPASPFYESQNIINNTDQPIKGSDYTVTIKNHIYCPDGSEEDYYSTKRGKDIKPNGSIWYEVIEGQHGYEEISKINLTLSEEELMNRFAPITGNEYQQYLDSKK